MRRHWRRSPAVVQIMRFPGLLGSIGGALALLVCACGDSAPAGGGMSEREPQRLILSADVGSGGDLVYIPFEVPAGVNRIDAELLEGSPADIGIGVFDPAGTAFLGLGFRGIAGKERRAFYITGDDATLGFVPGEISAGEWSLVLPNYYANGTAEIEVTLSFGSHPQTPALQHVPEQVRPQAGWYRGDLHVHTEHSSDAFNSGTSLSPAAMAQRAKDRGLDFIALTDHNVSTQNARLPDALPVDFLLLAGGEITTWIAGPGHLIVAGLQAGEFFDWRFRPVEGLWSKPQARWGHDEQPIQSALAYARTQGLFTSAAHPFVAPGFGSNWGFFPDSDRDSDALPDALEVWNDDFFITGGTATLMRWDVELAKGRRLCGNGGSDLHGIDNGIEVGTPTTVVYATELSRAGIVDALQACRAYVTSAPDGPALLLTATTVDGATVFMGDAVIGAPGDVATLNVRVLGGAGARLLLTRAGVPVLSRSVTTADESFTTRLVLGEQGAVRAELWPNAVSAPLGLNPLALSNPLYFGRAQPLPLRAPLPSSYAQHAIDTLSTEPRQP